MNYIDISVKNFTGAYTSKANLHGLVVKILLKTPAWSLTTVRLLGLRCDIEAFMASECRYGDMSQAAVDQHLPAIRHANRDEENPVAWKNRVLKELQ